MLTTLLAVSAAILGTITVEAAYFKRNEKLYLQEGRSYFKDRIGDIIFGLLSAIGVVLSLPTLLEYFNVPIQSNFGINWLAGIASSFFVSKLIHFLPSYFDKKFKQKSEE